MWWRCCWSWYFLKNNYCFLFSEPDVFKITRGLAVEASASTELCNPLLPLLLTRWLNQGVLTSNVFENLQMNKILIQIATPEQHLCLLVTNTPNMPVVLKTWPKQLFTYMQTFKKALFVNSKAGSNSTYFC